MLLKQTMIRKICNCNFYHPKDYSTELFGELVWEFALLKL